MARAATRDREKGDVPHRCGYPSPLPSLEPRWVRTACCCSSVRPVATQPFLRGSSHVTSAHLSHERPPPIDVSRKTLLPRPWLTSIVGPLLPSSSSVLRRLRRYDLQHPVWSARDSSWRRTSHDSICTCISTAKPNSMCIALQRSHRGSRSFHVLSAPGYPVPSNRMHPSG